MAKERIHSLFGEYFEGVPLLQVWEIGTEIIFGSDNEVGYKMLTEADPLPMVAAAKTNAKAFELFEQAMIYATRENLEIPDAARAFWVEYLSNPTIRPRKKRGPKSDHEFHWRLRLALLELKQEGVNPTRNSATDPETHRCGIDIVLEVLCSFDQSNEYTYENLEKRYFETLKKFPKPPSEIIP